MSCRILASVLGRVNLNWVPDVTVPVLPPMIWNWSLATPGFTQFQVSLAFENRWGVEGHRPRGGRDSRRTRGARRNDAGKDKRTGSNRRTALQHRARLEPHGSVNLQQAAAGDCAAAEAIEVALDEHDGAVVGEHGAGLVLEVAGRKG